MICITWTTHSKIICYRLTDAVTDPDWVQVIAAAVPVVSSVVRVDVEKSHYEMIVFQTLVDQRDRADRHHVVADTTASPHVRSLTINQSSPSSSSSSSSFIMVASISCKKVKFSLSGHLSDSNFVNRMLYVSFTSIYCLLFNTYSQSSHIHWTVFLLIQLFTIYNVYLFAVCQTINKVLLTDWLTVYVYPAWHHHHHQVNVKSQPHRHWHQWRAHRSLVERKS